MRRPSSAVLRSTLALLVVSCATDRPTGPRISHDVVALVGGTGTPLVLITELMPDPTKVADAAGEWFEVFNAGNTSVDMSGWKIVSGPSGAEQHTIAASVVIAPGGYGVFGNNTNSATNGGVSEQYSYGTAIALNNANTDWLELKLPDGTVVDSISYSAHSGATVVPPTFTPTAGASRVVVDINLDRTIVGGNANWINTPTSVTYGLGDRGTPGSGPYTPLIPGGEAVTVTVSPAVATVTVGQARQFSAIGRDTAGAISSSTFTWVSSDTAVATIGTNGLATGVAEGSVSIIATADNGIADTATLTVVPQVVATITVAINTPRQVPVGFVKPAFPTVKDAGGVTINPAPSLTWASSDSTIAAVDSLGYIMGRATGSVTITATAPNGVVGSSSFTVIPMTAPTSAIYRNNVEFGVPRDADASDDMLIVRPQYELSYNATRGGPNWVSWDLNASQFGAAPRCDCFSPDPTLPAAVYHVVDLDYRNGGYDRGHMTQSEERTTTDQENATTFYLDNVLPQAAENNQGPWSQFENFLNDLVRASGKEVYVISGGAFAAVPGTLKSEGKVAIPDYTWKVAVIVNGGAGVGDVHTLSDLQVIAVQMPNLTTPGPASAVGIRNIPWQNFQTTVDAIEAETGYDLLSALGQPLQTIVEANDHPPTASAGGPYTGDEGASVAFSAAGSSDPDGDALTYAWTFGDGTTGTGATPVHAYGDNGSYTATVTATDPYGATSSASVAVTIANVAPVISGVALPSGPVTVGGSAAVTVTFSDLGSGDTHETTVEWGDGSATTVGGEGSIIASHAYSAAGLYVVRATVADDDGGSATQTAGGYVVVFDAAAGFTTGSGWFGPPRDKTQFAFDARYGNDRVTPRGSVDLTANGGAFHFTAATVQWIVVSGNKATARGTGTIAGRAGTFQFLLVARDGGAGDGVRLKVWDAAGAVLYDNQPGAADAADAVSPLGGGNVQVHS